MKYIIGERSVTVYDGDKILTCGKDDYIYPEVVAALNEERWDDMSQLYHKRIVDAAKERLLNTGGKWVDDTV